MIGKFLSKYILEVIPSIVATVIGAYIVTHYINAKTDTDKPKAVVAAPANTAKAVGSDASDKTSEKTVEVPTPKAAKAEPVAKPSETASVPSETRRHQPMLREKAAAKSTVAPATEAAKETAKEVSKETAKEATKVEDTRDANEIAREAIARLRNSDQAKPTETPRTQETFRMPDTARPQERARVSVTYAPSIYAPSPPPQPPVQMLQTAPTMVPPLKEVTIEPEPQPPVARGEASFRPPTPPADIPLRPLDLRAKERDSVAEDVVATAKGVVSSAKSVFRAVIPDTN